MDDNQCAERGVVAPNHDRKCGSNGMDDDRSTQLQRLAEAGVFSEARKPDCFFHGHDWYYEGDNQVCTYCKEVIEQESTPEWSYGKFVVLTRAHTSMMDQASGRIQRILERMKHHGHLSRADEYGAVIEYNNACHCHPRMDEFTIPAEWLFAEDWEVKVDEYMRQLETKRLAAEAEIDKLRQAQERKDFERLRRKFESTEK